MDRPRIIRAAQIDLADYSVFRVGPLFVDPLAREVRFNGKSERLQTQPMKVLVALAGRRDEVVTREELIDSCWNGRIVGDDVINRAILLLRRTAKESDAFEIATVRGSGYRLTESGAHRRYKRWSVWISVAAIAAAAIAFLLLRTSPDQSHPPLATVELTPFDASADPLAIETARTSDAVVADMLANSGMPVIKPDRKSVDGKSADFRLSGQVRALDDRIEANLQLDDLAHGTLLLSRRFNISRKEARNLPEQMGAFAATALSTPGALMALDRQRPPDPRLSGELLRQWSMMVVFEDPISSYQAVDRIAAQMPDSAVAQLGLAMSTVHVLPLLAPEEREAALAKGRDAAARARALAPSYGDVAWADCRLRSPVRMLQCEAVIRQAFASDPHAPFVAAGLRNQLVDVGRFHEALAYDRLAVAAMPYMAGRLSASTALLEGLGARIAAEQQFQRARRWWPEFDQVFDARFKGMLDRGSLEDAAAFASVIPPDAHAVDRQAIASIASDVMAKRPERVQSRCLASSASSNVDHFCLVALIRVNDLDGAFELANRLFPNLMADDPKVQDRLFLAWHEEVGLSVLSTPALAPLRNDPRFIPIAKRVGLIRYWRQDHLPDFCTFGHERVCNVILGK